MEYACITDVGLIREKNQDSYVFTENSYGDILMLVADGIGGGNAGEVASSEAIGYFDSIFKESGPFDSREDARNFIVFHIDACNKHIHELSDKNAEYSGMGTTITGVFISSQGIFVINCGDSRVYGFSRGKLYRLTNDHTLINKWLEEGKITPQEAENHPKKHYLVKALGIFDDCKADIGETEDMECFLVCSDGLHAYVSDEEITQVLVDKDMSIDEKAAQLKDLALLKGGYDNITVVLIER